MGNKLPHRKTIRIIDAEGVESELAQPPSWPEMQKIVDGWLEHVTVLDCIVDGTFIYTSMYVNEDGLSLRLPRNEKATEIYQRNIRAQFPGEAYPFAIADQIFTREEEAKGVTVISANHAGVDLDDPHISGTAIYFQGWTVREVNDYYEELSGKPPV